MQAAFVAPAALRLGFPGQTFATEDSIEGLHHEFFGSRTERLDEFESHIWEMRCQNIKCGRPFRQIIRIPVAEHRYFLRCTSAGKRNEA
jgi:hypothetical protein